MYGQEETPDLVVLSRLVNFRDWDEMLELLAAHPNCCGNLDALRLLGKALFPIPLERLDVFVALARIALDDGGYLTFGTTILHMASACLKMACSRGTPDMVQAVFRLAGPEPEKVAFSMNNLQLLHSYCPWIDERLPLHAVCASETHYLTTRTVKIIRLLLDANPLTALIKNQGGVAAASILWDHHAIDESGNCILLKIPNKPLILQLACKFYNNESTLSLQDNLIDDSKQKQVALLWSMILIMANAAYQGEIGTSKEDLFCYPLHALAALDCPHELWKFALLLHGSHGLKEKDSNGHLPLHIVLNSYECRRNDSDMAVEYTSTTLPILLHHFPNAALEPFPTPNARLPLHVAISLGFQWHSELKCIFQAAPMVLGLRDHNTGLYPFMLAATVCVDDLRCVETIFELLSLDPNLVISIS
uniref:Uncharacterized protein n=1 Tax=Attheya septentrionalis TaxID=420275 RepID=A0A7S2U9N6_9STRA|mmetsp:Transcript_1428/g.2565  ORF Transcript_1428/g.2565 Transcript_1428/m.2565 type:complete len:419 (+) Transcript_1428:300-1556(+)